MIRNTIKMSDENVNNNLKKISERGIIICIEGLDCSGKTTQIQKIYNLFNDNNKKIIIYKYPNRETEIGKIIDKYLKNEITMTKESINLLFTANRWEFNDIIEENIKNGVNVILDRYVYSGLAYFDADNRFRAEWYFNQNKGLLKPDLTIYLDADPSILQKRKGYGYEKFENIQKQIRVYDNFKTYMKYQSPPWEVIDATLSIEEINKNIMYIIDNSIIKYKNSDIYYL